MEQNEKVVRKFYLAVRSSDVKTSTVDESGTKVIRDDQESAFLCPKDTQVIVGRMHLGDENGQTTYKYGELSFINSDSKTYEFMLSDVHYSDYMKESNSSYICPDGALIVGREHIGDENGNTRYAYKKLYARENKDAEWILCKRSLAAESNFKESSGLWAEHMISNGNENDGKPEKTYYAPMYGRSHDGDENGNTTTYFTVMEFDIE